MTTTHDQQPVTSYTDRLLDFLDGKGDEFTLDELRTLVNEFKDIEQKKKTERSDIVPVGRYKYKAVNDVANFDKQYLQWMLKQSWIDKYPGFVGECKKYI